MKRGIALYIDHMICCMILVVPAMAIIGAGGRLAWGWYFIALLAGVMIEGGLFVAADYFWGGMTLGKRIVGARMVWAQGEGKERMKAAVVHTLFKLLLLMVWPITLVIVLVSGGRMPYDARLGISYVKEEKKAGSVIKTIGRVVLVVVLFVLFLYGGILIFLRKINSESCYHVGDIQVPAVSSVLKDTSLRSYASSGGGNHVEITYGYRLSGDGSESARHYMEYLIQNNDFELIEKHHDNDIQVLVLKMYDTENAYEVNMILASYGQQLQVEISGGAR